MRPSRAILLLWVSAAAACGGKMPASSPVPSPEVSGAEAAVQNEELRQELLAMAAADKEARTRLLSLIAQTGGQTDSSATHALIAQLQAVDSTNLSRLREIVREHGWPGKRLVGSEGASAVFSLVQHDPSPELGPFLC